VGSSLGKEGQVIIKLPESWGGNRLGISKKGLTGGWGRVILLRGYGKEKNQRADSQNARMCVKIRNGGFPGRWGGQKMMPWWIFLKVTEKREGGPYSTKT